MTLPPYNPDAKCPKCGGGEIGSEYLSAQIGTEERTVDMGLRMARGSYGSGGRVMTGVPFTDGRGRAGAEVIDFGDARNERFARRLVKLLRSHGYTDAQIAHAAERLLVKLRRAED